MIERTQTSSAKGYSDSDGLNSATFREAMSRIPHSVYIVTTDGPAGRAGLTATAVTSVAASPPTLLICLNALNTSTQAFRTNSVIAVNCLTGDQVALANIFGTPIVAPCEEPTPEQLRELAEQRFDHGHWLPAASPVLRGANVVFEGRIIEMKPVETHLVLFVRVTNVRIGERGSSLVYHERNYRVL